MSHQKLSSICIIIPYFGSWPRWIQYFWESCKFNPSINWIFYTDCGTPDSLPSNVKVIDISFDDYCHLVSQKLSISFSPNNPYKLCDIKPLLGFLHEDELSTYDLWGFGDIDVIYGDLRAYFSEDRLASKDLFSTHARRISGHLCLLRNTSEMRTAFRKVKNWQTLIASDQHKAFDEKAFSKLFLRHKNSPKFVRQIAAVIDPWLRKGEFVEAYSTPNGKIAWLDSNYIFPKKWFWKNGLLTNDINGERLFPYFHFMVWKKNWINPSIGNFKFLSSEYEYYLSKEGIFQKE